MGLYQLRREQAVSATIDEIWDFISNPGNLKLITPGYMGFDISGVPPGKMYPGMIISYTVKPLLGMKMLWVSEITHVIEKQYFVDEQRSGPYKMWHHEHFIKPVPAGVLMTDIVSYIPPAGFIGKIANSLLIRKELKKIFDYREMTLAARFNKKGGS
jgi:ligand-binding SRPBCC domain-containing protein